MPFERGKSGNPSGRPPSAPKQRLYGKQKPLGKAKKQAIARLTEIVNKSDANDNIKMQASRALLQYERPSVFKPRAPVPCPHGKMADGDQVVKSLLGIPDKPQPKREPADGKCPPECILLGVIEAEKAKAANPEPQPTPYPEPTDAKETDNG